MIINSRPELVKQKLPEMGVDAFAMLFALASHLGTGRVVWPGIERLRKMCRVKIKGQLRPMPEKRAYAAIRELINQGMAERYQDRQENGDFGQRKFRITTEYIDVFIRFTNTPMEQADDPRLDESRQAPQRQAPNDQTEEVLLKGNSEQGDQPKISSWQEKGEERFQTAYKAATDYLNEEPTRWQLVAETAKNKATKSQLEDELILWLRHHQDDYMIMKDATQKIYGGKGSFFSWLAQPWCKKKYEPAAPKKSAGSYNRRDEAPGFSYDRKRSDINNS